MNIVIIGLTTPGSQIWSSPTKLEGAKIEGVKTAAHRWIRHIKQKIPHDLIIGLFHVGTNPYRDDENSKLGRISPANETLKVLESISDFDLVISAHDHYLNPSKTGKPLRYVQRTPVVSGGKHGEAVLKIVIKLSKAKIGWQTLSMAAEVLRAKQNRSIREDYLKRLEQPYLRYINASLPWKLDKTSRKKAAECFNTLMAISHQNQNLNGTLFPYLSLNSIQYLIGRQLTRQDLFKIVPYDNRAVTVKLSKRDLYLLNNPTPASGLRRIPYNRVLYMSLKNPIRFQTGLWSRKKKTSQEIYF